jgi:adenylate cyclase
LSATAKFCSECGAALSSSTQSAEYKQVTVLFADVVHSMDIAAAVGAERLREIMTELVDRAVTVVRRYGGTVDKFTGDGIMAVFGAPIALEDLAVRACLAALGIQDETGRLASEVKHRDRIDLGLRIGLNSGQVIAGDVGSTSLGYTAVGEQVGMAQRMESVAPSGGVMLSESTARLVDGAAAVGEPEMVQIKGAVEPVPARRLLGLGQRRHAIRRAESNLVGRHWEMSATEGLLNRAIDGHGVVAGLVGPLGVGKSRLVREVAAMAAARDVEVFTAFCESHANQVPFQVVARLLRAATGIEGFDPPAARARIRAQAVDAEPEDLLLFDDLLGIGDPDAALPKIDPDARRRRLTALVSAALLAREAPAVYVVEDAHWIDEVSESMLADFLMVIPQTPSLVLVTYRPEYHGALTQLAGAQTIALAPLTDPETVALVAELLGPDPSVGALGQMIADRAAGNPFFAEEIVRELAGRGVLRGEPGAYLSTAEIAEVSVPATLQATIAARIDRLDANAKQTLNAAAVIGSRFTTELLTAVGTDPVLDALVTAELIDQVRFTPHAEYAFRHPLIRAVAYESQLKSDRANLHRRLAAAIEAGDPAAADENAALIAEHLEAAGDLHVAYAWHMRAAAWSVIRDIVAAHLSWERARQIADRLPDEEPDRPSMRIAPRTLLCATAWRVVASIADSGFDELRELTMTADDQASLATGMAGLLMTLTIQESYRESSRLASEYIELIESMGEPAKTAGLLYGAVFAKFQAGEAAEALRLARRVVHLADGEPATGNAIIGSPMTWANTMAGLAECSFGRPGWRHQVDRGVAAARDFDVASRVIAIAYPYAVAISNGALLPDAIVMRDTAKALQVAQQAGDDFMVVAAQVTRAIALIHGDGPERAMGFDLLAKVRENPLVQQFRLTALMADIQIAEDHARTGDLDAAIELSRAIVKRQFETGEMAHRGPATSVLVETLLRRGAAGDLLWAKAAIDRLAAVTTDPGFVLHELPLLRLRALLAQGGGDQAAYRDYRDRYRAMATSFGFEGHIKWAEAMP